MILSGGELTVTIRGKGRGGPNQEYALALAAGLDGMPASPRWPRIPTAPTAARDRQTIRPAPMSTATTAARARALGLDPAAIPGGQQFDSFLCCSWTDLITPGPTFTNVNDFRAIMVNDIDMA